MRQLVAAIRSGFDPVVPLPPAAFHRFLEDPIYCPKCEATYFLVVDYDWAVSHYFEQESRRHIALLRKAVFLGHSHGHRFTHFETNGVEVTRHTASDVTPSNAAQSHATKYDAADSATMGPGPAKAEPAQPLAHLPPLSRHIQ